MNPRATVPIATYPREYSTVTLDVNDNWIAKVVNEWGVCLLHTRPCGSLAQALAELQYLSNREITIELKLV